MATLASAENLDAIGLFASFFIPFYFFHNGLEVPSAALVSASENIDATLRFELFSVGNVT